LQPDPEQASLAAAGSAGRSASEWRRIYILEDPAHGENMRLMTLNNFGYQAERYAYCRTR
jgi:hypothetical protein